jgi:hypothetical protein
MKPELLCTWLGLEKTTWPPEPRTLLGLARDEHDLAVVEKRVHDCMNKLRTYQLSYPEEATEGMNRLAEAFITLTEACSKERNGAAVEAGAKPSAPPDWRAEPPPVRKEPAETPELMADEPTNDVVLVAKPFAAPSKPILRIIDPILTRDLAEESAEATSHLATLDAVIERVEQTRRVLHAWDQLGRWLKKGLGKKTSVKESELFAARLDKVRQAMESYPPFLGQPGKPGYRVMVQARLKVPLAMVRGMTDDQREELLFDWEAGRQVLLTHRKYIHRLFKSMRHRTALGLFWHAARALVNDHPLLTMAAVVVVLAIIGGVVMALRR